MVAALYFSFMMKADLSGSLKRFLNFAMIRMILPYNKIEVNHGFL